MGFSKKVKEWLGFAEESGLAFCDCAIFSVFLKDDIWSFLSLYVGHKCLQSCLYSEQQNCFSVCSVHIHKAISLLNTHQKCMIQVSQESHAFHLSVDVPIT